MATLQKKKKERLIIPRPLRHCSPYVFLLCRVHRVFITRLVLGYLACVKGSLFWPVKTDVERILLNAILMFGNKGMSKGRSKLD